MTNTINLLLLGDICPTEDTRYLFDSGSPEELMGELCKKTQAADIAFANLECVLSNEARAAEKIGPILIGHPSDAMVLAKAGIDLVGIANNHIGDCGPKGVLDTMQACVQANIKFTGSGLNRTQAQEPAVITKNGLRVGFLAVAEKEFNAAGKGSAGANIFDPLQHLHQISKIKEKCDYLVVLYHGGIEYHQYPSPLLQKTCRSLIHSGADLVLCQHSHCIGTHEKFENGEILYGQGNSVFGYRTQQNTWNQGLAVEVTLTKRADQTIHDVSYLPIGTDSSGRVDMLSNDKAETVLSSLETRSIEAQDTNFIEEKWVEFCQKLSRTHMPHLLGFSKTLTRINRLTKGLFVEKFYSRKQLLTMMNVIRCDAHRDVLQTDLEHRCYQPAKTKKSA